MRKFLLILFVGFSSSLLGQSSIDLTNWQLELPTGYKASDWKLSNFQNDRFAKPFFYLDSLDGALVMKAYPVFNAETASKYTKNTLREQMTPGSNSNNWTMEQGAKLEAEFQITEMSSTGNKYDRTLLFTIHGRTTKEQNERLGLSKSESLPLFKVFWQNERIRVQRKVPKDPLAVGDSLLDKDFWEDDEGRYFNTPVGFDKTKISIEVSKGMVKVSLNDEKPLIYKDISVKKIQFENYFEVGNYLQSKESGANCTVKFYSLNVTH